MKTAKLAIDGDKPLRQTPLPSRKVFGDSELEMVKRVFEDSWKSGIDFFSQGKFEEKFTKKYCEFHGGGYADAVNSGTAAVYVAFQALDVEPGSDVIVSPATNPGGIMPIALQNVKMIIPDSEPNSFNISPDKFEKSITPKTLTSGGNGGIIYTKNKDLHWHARSLADRGKPFLDPNYHFRMTTNNLYPALNHNTDELSCAMGISSLARLQKTINKRLKIVKKIDQGLNSCSAVYPVNLALPDTKPSIFFHTVGVKIEKLKVPKVQFANAIAAEGITINADYRDITCEWQWIPKYVREYNKTSNALNFRDRTFNILFHEQFGDKEVEDIIESILKVEKFYAK